MKKMIFSLALGLASVSLVSQVHSQARLDPFFGQDGKIVKSIQDGKSDRGEVIATDGKGRYYVAGMTGLPDSIDFFIARYLPDGNLDLSYGARGFISQDMGGEDHVHGLSVAEDGLAYVSGYSIRDGKAVFAVLSVKPDGTLNSGFGREGAITTDLGGWAEIHYSVLVADKRLLVAGFVQKNNDADFAMARYKPDGGLDVEFGDEGILTLDWTRKDRFYGLVAARDVYYAAGSALNAGKGEDCVVGAFDASGRRIKDFGFGGLSLVSFGGDQDVCSSVTLQKNGQILAAGYINDKTGRNPDFAVARLNTNGTLDAGFGSNGFTRVDFDGGIDVVHAIDLSSSEIILTGESEIKGNQGVKSRFSLARLDAQGNPVTSWGDKGRHHFMFQEEFSEQAMGAVVDKKGDIVLVGHAEKNVALAKVLLREPDKKKKQ